MGELNFHGSFGAAHDHGGAFSLIFDKEFFFPFLIISKAVFDVNFCLKIQHDCSARDWDGKDYLRIIPRVVLVEDPRLT
jgi:hypothetical protein